MPLFEVGDGRARVVQPDRPGADSFAQEVGAILAQHLDVVLGEPVMVVHLRPGGPRGGLPDVLAVDVHRSPVVVDVVPVLDEAALMATLQRAGAVARLTRREVALLFHPHSPERFDAAVRGFLDSVALSAGGPPRPGMRVVLLVQQIAPEVVDSLAFWRARGRLDVILVGAVQGVDGRRLLTVETLGDLGALGAQAGHDAARSARAAGNGSLPVDVTQSLPIVAARVRPDPLHPVIGLEPDEQPDEAGGERPGEWSGEQPDSRLLERPAAPRIANPVLVAPRGASAVVPGGSGSATAPTPPRGGPAAGHGPRRTSSVLLPPPPGEVHGQPVAQVRPAGVGLLSGPPGDQGREHSVAALRARESLGEPPTTRPYVVVPPPPPPPVRRDPDGAVQPVGPRWSAAPQALSPQALSPQAAEAQAAEAQVPAAHPQLRTLAEATSAPAALVWHRRRRGQRLAAWLRADGLLALSSGELFADPSQAASAAAGTDGQVDGWRAWRFGDDGPTLQEAVEMVAG